MDRVTIIANKVGRNDISLDIEECDAEGFRSFIQNFTNGTFEVFPASICSLRGRKPFLRDYQKTGYLNYFDVTFVAAAANVTLECRFMESDLYLIAFRPINSIKWYALKNWIHRKYMVLNMDVEPLLPPLSGDYPNLEQGPKTRRTNHLGRQSLFDAVIQLGKYKPCQKSNLYLRPYLLTVIEMTSEAIRFPQILDAICDAFYYGARLQDSLVSLTNNFDKLSKKFASNAINERKVLIPEDEFNQLGVVKEVDGIEYEETSTGFVVVASLA